MGINSEISAGAHAKECLRVYEEIVRAVDAQYCALQGTSHTTVHSRAHIKTALIWMAGIAVRHLKAALSDLHQGWEPESAVHIRTAWEGAIDMAFLLGQGRNRGQVARLYLDITDAREVLVLAAVRAMTPEEFVASPQVLPEQKRSWQKHADAAQGKSKKSPEACRLDLRKHWSGLSLGEVRGIAQSYIERDLIGNAKNSFGPTMRRLVFDLGSKFSHADPGILFLIPSDQSGPRIEPEPPMNSILAINACTVGLYVLLTLARHRGRNWFNGVMPYVQAYVDLVTPGSEVSRRTIS